jgi:hypothetical protein
MSKSSTTLTPGIKVPVTHWIRSLVEARPCLDCVGKILDTTGTRTPTSRSLGLQKIAVLVASYNAYYTNFSVQFYIKADGILKGRWFEFGVHLSINCATEYTFAR